MSFYSQFEIKIENDQIIKVFYAYNENSTFDDFLEFLTYYFPDKNFCPCYKFKGMYDFKEFMEIDMNWKIKSCINKYTKYEVYITNEDKECHCSPEFKDNFKKSKKYLINNLSEKKENLNNLSINKDGLIKANENLNNKINLEDFYDIIIDIKSIKDICKGWHIKKSKRAEKDYESFIKDSVIKIGVIGNSNKGKSFLLSKISKINLPSGTSIRTEGLSIKYPELNEKYKNRKIVLLDSAGLETPVLSDGKIINNKANNEKKENEQKKEKEKEEKEKDEKEEKEIENKNEKDEIQKNINNENGKDTKKNYKELFKEKSRE